MNQLKKIDMIQSLHFINAKGAWNPVPDWTKWYFQTGILVGSTANEGKRLVLGVSTPLRAFASVFIALGIIYERSDVPLEKYDCREYFEFLKSFPRLTGVSFLTDEGGKLRRRDGKLDGTGWDGSREYISVLYIENAQNRNTRCWRCFHTDNCRWITVTEAKDINIKSAKKRGSAVVNNLPFLSKLLAEEQITDFTTGNQLDCLFVGSKKRTLSELECDLGLKEREGFYLRSNLKDIIRPKNLYCYGQSFRSRIHSAYSKKPPRDDGKPLCIIFNSANGYLKWNYRFGSSHQVVLLDRSEHLYESAVLNLNDRFYQRFEEPPVIGFELPTPPPGIEVIAFLERCHD